MKPTRLEAWTTALQADIAKTGSIESKRLDLIMGTDAQNGKGATLYRFCHDVHDSEKKQWVMTMHENFGRRTSLAFGLTGSL